ncbi:hypothetical protein PHLCEN_2v10277 [Hermanssonia centrifuga]|uniref:Methyltransferase n=1 Tax=Hermanssonia centrifuga TaxID=98765 RepID=A0A2R6NND9_9APHY|nr:hypothetical protein PHLCEN_2v10277 [Hermanssonia centrifuga]
MTISPTNTAKANLIYFAPPADGSKPYTHVNADPATGVRQQNWIKESHDNIEIENLRGKEDTVTLDTAGFQFFTRPQKYTAFANDEEIEREYYPESIELVKQLTGASRIVVFDHTIRRRRPGEVDDSPQKRQPVLQVHVDQTADSAIARVHRHLPASDAPELLKHRFQIINLWRPINHAAYDWPLALCDYRSIDVDHDLVPTILRYPDRDGETLGVQYNPNHRWKYLKGMVPDEFVLIKCFDSKDDGKTAILTPHTAFDDVTKPEGSPLRESIELRLLVFYDD